MRALIAFTFLLAPAALAQGTLTSKGALSAQGAFVDEVRPPELLISGYNSDAVHRFDPVTGQLLGAYTNIPGAQAIVLGADGLLYICAEKIDVVMRFDPNTGQKVDDFIADDPLTPIKEAGPLDGPTSVVFGPGGDLYVASFENDRILRYDGRTGAFLGPFVEPQDGGLNGPDAGMTFGPGGDLYVPSYWTNEVLIYDGTSGAYKGDFASPGEGGLFRPRVVRFRRDGSCYVSSEGSNEILRFDHAGNFLDVFASTVTPTGMDFGRHDGDLYVTSATKSYIKQLEVPGGALLAKPLGNDNGIVDAGVFAYFIR